MSRVEKDPIRARLIRPVTDATLFDEARQRDAALRAVLDAADDHAFCPGGEDFECDHDLPGCTANSIREVIAEALGVEP